jgi:ATPase subunit of ABC transporter with duplicated ATPase domains
MTRTATATVPQLSATGLCIDTPSGRPLIRDLEMQLDSERVAVVGRNGVGKTALLEVLAGNAAPARGRVECRGTRPLVHQRLEARTTLVDVSGSAGEIRQRLLEQARKLQPDFLLLDEPSQDLDEPAIDWLSEWLEKWPSALVVVTHDRRLLRSFNQFFVVEERGCRPFFGSFDELLCELERQGDDANRKYAAELQRLLDKEEHNAVIRSRRARKKAGGRVRELKRCPARARLNAKRGYAQKYQAKREGVREQRITAARELARASRRALSVELPLELALPAGAPTKL